jgi:hypothetical protein
VTPGAGPPPVPDPPDLNHIDPLVREWPADLAIVRVFDLDYGATEFNPGVRTEPRGRFHFFENAAGARVPVLYGAEGQDAAIAETVFHDAPLGAGAVVPARRLAPLALAHVVPTRALRLAELMGHGLRRLGARAAELTDTDAVTYPRTVRWAAALHAASADLDGLIWMSRQFNEERVCVLFGDRVRSGELRLVGPVRPLLAGSGRRAVESAANRAGVIVV